MPKIRAFFSQAMGQKIARTESLSQLKKLVATLGADND
jgi:hypothetical protein